ncbi:putative Glycosyl hydrolase BNR repeat-containing protein [Desulfamplus magnetovallimortis]|uniref:exo-alpha-sialidase n=1 Tax=Desulfamplus magnetovallimortis TaxID=1246637 RepID=A0A1W1HCC9_9BACT|nr:sialidase family protein [Desulfamplus magnetovallimortis]SLM30109.1 putative Glycosyl hydrolase BNR repeat-containing protein [Desulfamplus magnetovallimortis]
MFKRSIIINQRENSFYHIPSIVTAPDGSILAFCEQRWQSPCDDVGECHIVMTKSIDHGKTWSPMQELRRKDGAKWHMGSAITDMAEGKVLLMCGGGWLQSIDNGDTWLDWKPALHADKTTEGVKYGIGSTHGSTPGIQLQYGKHKNRLVWPARIIISDSGYNDKSISDRREKCYSTVIYSDDHGQNLYRSNSFHQGTGEACLIERINGDIYFNARAYYNDGKRRVALSHDGGTSFMEAPEDVELREVPQGCNASMIRYPQHLLNMDTNHGIPSNDIVLFANPDTEGSNREHGVVRLSIDGGETWKYSRAVTDYGQWFDYSSMTVANDGTILLMYKTTPSMEGIPNSSDECCSMAIARFDLGWLMENNS